MWHLNRHPHDRPESAREALSLFLKNDRMQNQPPISTGKPPTSPAGPPLRRPAGVQPTTPSPVHPPQTILSPEISNPPAAAPQPLAPPDGSKPSVHTSQHELEPATALARQTTTVAASTKAPPTAVPQPQPQNVKSKPLALILGALAAVLVLGLLGWFLFIREGPEQILNNLVAESTKTGATEVMINQESLDIALNALASPIPAARLQEIGRVLRLAKPIDGTDIDGKIAAFITDRADLSKEARVILISDVLAERDHPAVVPTMLGLTRSPEPAVAVAALRCVRKHVGSAQFDGFIADLSSASDSALRIELERILIDIIRRHPEQADVFLRKTSEARDATLDQDMRATYKRLIDAANAAKSR
jgi:hypothetical protein